MEADWPIKGGGQLRGEEKRRRRRPPALVGKIHVTTTNYYVKAHGLFGVITSHCMQDGAGPWPFPQQRPGHVQVDARHEGPLVHRQLAGGQEEDNGRTRGETGGGLHLVGHRGGGPRRDGGARQRSRRGRPVGAVTGARRGGDGPAAGTRGAAKHMSCPLVRGPCSVCCCTVCCGCARS